MPVLSKVGDGRLPLRLEAFLLSVLRENSAKQYARVLDAFWADCRLKAVRFGNLSKEARDIYVAEYILDCKEEQRGTRNEAQLLLSALRKIMPRMKFVIAWRVVDTWKRHEPVKQSPAAPPELAKAIAVVAVAYGRSSVGAVSIFGFSALLRCGETLELRRRDVHLGSDCLVLTLGRTKRGEQQKVSVEDSVDDGFLRLWLLAFLEGWSGGPDDRLFPASYSQIYYWLGKICAFLGVSHWGMKSHSFRRGGASSLLAKRWAMENILVQGRWASISSAREYLKKGEVALLRLRAADEKEVWRTLALWTALGPSVFELGLISVEKTPIAEGKVANSSSSEPSSSSSSQDSDSN